MDKTTEFDEWLKKWIRHNWHYWKDDYDVHMAEAISDFEQSGTPDFMFEAWEAARENKTTIREVRDKFEAWMNNHEDTISEDIFEQVDNPEDDEQKQVEKLSGLCWDLQAKAFYAGFIEAIASLSPSSTKGFTARRKRKSQSLRPKRATFPVGREGELEVQD